MVKKTYSIFDLRMEDPRVFKVGDTVLYGSGKGSINTLDSSTGEVELEYNGSVINTDVFSIASLEPLKRQPPESGEGRDKGEDKGEGEGEGKGEGKPEAKKAAEQALAKHYYENGLEEYKNHKLKMPKKKPKPKSLTKKQWEEVLPIM